MTFWFLFNNYMIYFVLHFQFPELAIFHGQNSTETTLQIYFLFLTFQTISRNYF